MQRALVLTFSILAPLWAAVGCRCGERTEDPNAAPRAPDAWSLGEVLDRVGPVDEDPAATIPSSVHVYVRLKGAAGVLDNEDKDPLAKEAWTVIETMMPGGFWQGAAEKLGLEERELLRRLFVGDLVLADQTIHRRRRLVVMSKVEPDLLAKLPEAASLETWKAQPEIGPFRLYQGGSEGQDYVLAIGPSWLAFSSLDGADHVRNILVARSAGQESLRDKESYRDLFGRLPENPDAVMFTQSHDRPEAHALTVVRDGARFEARYAARAPKVKKYIEALDAKNGVDFGPLPVDVVVAGSVNLLTRDVPSEGVLDMLLFPHSFRERVLSRIEPPLLFFLGKVDRRRIEPDPGFHVPVFGFAIRLKDRRAAADLDRICSGIHFLVSVGKLALAEGFFGVDEVKRKNVKYHLADFGPLLRSAGDNTILAKMASLPSAKGLTRVAYGRIGDFYVVCTQEQFFHQWREAEAQRQGRLSSSEDYNLFEFENRDGLIISALTRGKELSELLNGALSFIKRAEGNAEDPDSEPEAGQVNADRKIGREREPKTDDESRIQKPLRWLANGLEQSRTFSIQMWHTDGGLLEGRLVVLR